MELKPIHTKKDYQAALAEIERLWDAPAKSADADKLHILNRTRPLTLEMIRRLALNLKLPAEVLVRPYPLRRQRERLAA